MVAYNVQNTAGVNVATINVSTTTGTTFPVELIGQGISIYGGIVAQNTYRLLENFAEATPPSNPVTGMFWYSTNLEIPHYYDGSQFIPLSTATSSFSTSFDMLPAATNIDFTTAGVTDIFQAPGNGNRYHPSGVILIPNGAVSASTPATFNLYVDTSEDVLENAVVSNFASNKHAFFSIEGSTRFVEGTEFLRLEVTSPATGGSINFDAVVFGYTTN